MAALGPGETDDLAKLPRLDAQVILNELKHRYSKDKIYVRCDNYLIMLCMNQRRWKFWMLLKFFGKILSIFRLTEMSFDFLRLLFKLQTYVGDILIAVNPFKTLKIYDKNVSYFLVYI